MKKLILFLGMVVGAVAAAMVVFKYLNRDEPLPAGSMERSASADLPAFDESELGGTVSPELLSILVCPEDRGPLTLSNDGKWLVNPRNGYRYPIRKGIPVMLIEEGRRNRDASLMA
ncbi:MAG: Trm112 family protein [Caldilineales bacterium]